MLDGIGGRVSQFDSPTSLPSSMTVWECLHIQPLAEALPVMPLFQEPDLGYPLDHGGFPLCHGGGGSVVTVLFLSPAFSTMAQSRVIYHVTSQQFF